MVDHRNVPAALPKVTGPDRFRSVEAMRRYNYTSTGGCPAVSKVLLCDKSGVYTGCSCGKRNVRVAISRYKYKMVWCFL